MGRVRRLLAIGITILILLALSSPAQASPEYTTYYGPGYCGNTTASGDTFDCSLLSAAHPTYEFGTKLLVCWDECVVVEVTDRGPNLDLSPAAATRCGLLYTGPGQAEVTLL